MPTFARVRYTGVYPGIAMDYHGTTGTLEYDFRLAPHADPSQIAVGFGGAPLRIARSGALVAGAPGRSIRQAPPVAYQPNADGSRDPVDARFQIHGGKIGFDLGAYDRSRPLIIDPLVLDYSTYLGGTGNYDQAMGIAVDPNGNAYVAGLTNSDDYPATVGAYDTTHFSAPPYSDYFDAVVTKLNPTGTAAVYSTYLGGNRMDKGTDVAVDANGNAYVTGYTASVADPTAANNFPGTAIGTSNDNGLGDAFVVKLNASGSSIIYSTTFGGKYEDETRGIAIDGSGNAYIAGATDSTGSSATTPFPTTAGVSQPNDAANSTDAFVTKLNSTGTALAYSTYLGGAGQDEANGIDVDSQGRAYVTGFEAYNGNTPTDNYFPVTANAYEDTNTLVSSSSSDAFLTRFNATGQRDYSTLLGGEGSESSNAVAVGADGIAYVTGYSTKPGSTADAFDLKNEYEGPNGQCCYGTDLFVSKFDTDASGADSLVYSTLIGGSGTETGTGIDVDSNGSAVITGVTGNATGEKYDTTADAFSTTPFGSALITKLSPSGSSLVYSTVLPNGGSIEPSAIALNGDDVFIAGTTKNTDGLATTPTAFQPTRPGGDWDGFVAKVSTSAGPPDTTPPDTSITSGPSEGSTVNTSSVSFGFTANETSTFQCKWDSEAYSACTTPSSRTLADGLHTFSVKAKDTSNNEDLTPATRSFTVSTGPPPDTTPPNTTITKAPAESIKSRKLPVDVSFSFSSSEGGSTFKCSFDGKSASPCTSPKKYSADKGSHTFSVYATDSSGNPDATPATATVKVKKKRKRHRH